MNSVRGFHEEAMNLAELAFVARLRGESQRAGELVRQAFENEARAAELVRDDLSAEPTRSVLLRSAASLAIDCGELREAERLVAAGLAGNPPEDIAEELRQLFDAVNFSRHLEVRGISLQPDEVQMSLSGRAVGLGMVLSDTLTMRIEDARKLVGRTVERLMGSSYRDAGAPPATVRQYGLYVSVPRAASFAVSLRIAGPGRTTLPTPFPDLEDTLEYVAPSRVIDEILACLEDFSRSDEEALRQRIQDDAYYRNFVGLARNLAPDGEQVSQVGFTAMRDGRERRVALTRTRRELVTGIPTQSDELREPETDIVVLTGRLRYADDAVKSKGQYVCIVDEERNIRHTVRVPEGMMTDVVSPHFREIVVIRGRRRRDRRRDIVELEDISRDPLS